MGDECPMKDLNELLSEFFELKHQIDKLKTQQDFIKHQLKLLLEVEKVESLDGDKGYVLLQHRTTESLDKEKIKTLLNEKFDDVVTLKTSSFVVVKEK